MAGPPRATGGRSADSGRSAQVRPASFQLPGCVGIRPDISFHPEESTRKAQVVTSDVSRSGISFLHAKQLYPGERILLWLPTGKQSYVVERVRRAQRQLLRNRRCGRQKRTGDFDELRLRRPRPHSLVTVDRWVVVRIAAEKRLRQHAIDDRSQCPRAIDACQRKARRRRPLTPASMSVSWLARTRGERADGMVVRRTFLDRPDRLHDLQQLGPELNGSGTGRFPDEPAGRQLALSERTASGDSSESRRSR